jgi:hypothetical protein
VTRFDWALLLLMMLVIEIQVVRQQRKFERELLMHKIKHTMFVEEMRNTLKKEKE